jgi:predicted small integral membrane protein
MSASSDHSRDQADGVAATRPRGSFTARWAAAAVLTASVALYIALVAFGNITDFDTNRQFVRHVLAMDTTFRDEDLMWRAVTSRAWQDAAYVAIIVWETASALVLIAGAWLWLRRDPRRARAVSTTGLSMLLLLFGAGFLAIGGEWFAMWQSEKWNGLESATRIVLLSGLALLTVQATGDREGAGRSDQRPRL